MNGPYNIYLLLLNFFVSHIYFLWLWCNHVGHLFRRFFYLLNKLSVVSYFGNEFVSLALGERSHMYGDLNPKTADTVCLNELFKSKRSFQYPIRFG